MSPVMDTQDLLNRFSYHAAVTEERQDAHAQIRRACLDLAGLLDNWVPEGREKALAVTKLEEVMFWANAGVARPPATR